jgi:hypothetical protein
VLAPARCPVGLLRPRRPRALPRRSSRRRGWRQPGAVALAPSQAPRQAPKQAPWQTPWQAPWQAQRSSRGPRRLRRGSPGSCCHAGIAPWPLWWRSSPRRSRRPAPVGAAARCGRRRRRRTCRRWPSPCAGELSASTPHLSTCGSLGAGWAPSRDVSWDASLLRHVPPDGASQPPDAGTTATRVASSSSHTAPRKCQ